MASSTTVNTDLQTGANGGVTQTTINTAIRDNFQPYQIALTPPGGTLDADNEFNFEFSYDGTLTNFEIVCSTPGSGSSAAFNLRKATSWNLSGINMLNSNLSLSAGQYTTGTTSFALDAVTGGDKGVVTIEQADLGGVLADAIAIITIEPTI